MQYLSFASLTTSRLEAMQNLFLVAELPPLRRINKKVSSGKEYFPFDKSDRSCKNYNFMKSKKWTYKNNIQVLIFSFVMKLILSGRT